MTLKFRTIAKDIVDFDGTVVELLEDSSGSDDRFAVSVGGAIVFETDDYYDARSEFEYRIGENDSRYETDADEFDYAVESFDSDLWYGNDLFA